MFKNIELIEDNNSELIESVDNLPEDLKTVIILKYFHGYTINEVSEILEISVPTVKNRLHKALNFLEKNLRRVVMSKNIFEEEKRNYENIEIPEELNFRVKKAIKIGKKEVLKKRIYNVGKSIAALFIIFVASVNISSTAAEAFSSIQDLKS